MNTAEALVTIFECIKKITDPIEGKNAASDAVFLAINDLLDAGVPVTPKALEEKLIQHAEDYLAASKKTDVA